MARISLHDSVAVVTGSGHRVGKAIALALAAQGVHIAVHYHRSEDAAYDTVREIKSLGVDALAVQADQSDPQQVTALFDAVRDHFGKLNILVNSASLFKKTDFMDMTPAEWQRILDVNLTGPFLCSQAAARMMLEADEPAGAIINIIDNIGRLPWPEFPHHSVAKSGLLMLTQILARSLAPAIRVNAVIPGPVLKPDHVPDEYWHSLGQRLPMQRTGTAEDVGRAVTFLAQEDFLTGAILSVDGGEWLTNVSGDEQE